MNEQHAPASADERLSRCNPGLAVHRPRQPHYAHLGRQWTWTRSPHECRENNSENGCCNAKMAARKARRSRLPVSLHCKRDGEPWMTGVLSSINTHHTQTPAGGPGAKTWAAAGWLLPCLKPQQPRPKNHQAPRGSLGLQRIILRVRTKVQQESQRLGQPTGWRLEAA